MLRPLITVLTAALLLTGCSRPSYINVPNDGGDAAINGPNWVTTIQIEKAALRYLLSQDPMPVDVVLLLPRGTTERTAFDVAADLAEYNVFPVGHAPSDEYQVLEVRSVVARGGRGRVDIIRPGTLRDRELVEVHMDWSVVSGWQADYLRVRNIDVGRLDPMRLAKPAATPEAEPARTEEPVEIEDDANDGAGDAEHATEESVDDGE